MNMRKIIAVMAAVLMLCTLIPVSVFAAPGDVVLDINFDDGTNGGFNRSENQDGYIVFDATTGNWQNTWTDKYARSFNTNTDYVVTFKAKANKNTTMNFKINDNWGSDAAAFTVNVTTEWQEFEGTINMASLSGAIVMFSSNSEAANAAIYYIDDVKIAEYKDPATIGKVVNGDFSTTDGWKLGAGATIADGVLNLNNPNLWGEAALQSVPAKANTEYEITWKSQRISGTGAFNLFVMDASNANLTKVAGQNWMNETSGNWVNNTYTINTGASEVIKIKFSTEANNPGQILIDDFKITEIKDPSFDGYIYNGDFEIGKANFGTSQVSTTGAWYNLWGSTTHELVAGYNGDYALKGTASGSYNITYQNVAVEPNTNYTVWAYSKNSSNANLWIKNAGGNGDITNKAFNSGSDWALTSLSFNSGSNSTVWVGLMGISAGATYTVDDIFMFETQPESNDGYIVNGTFETGALTPWNNLWGSCPTAEIVKGGKDSTFALHVVSGQWKHVRQMPITVEPNTDYNVSVWAKDAKNMSLLIKGLQDDKSTETNDIKNIGLSAGDEWTQFTGTFNSGNHNYVIVSFMGTADDAYGTFDTVVMEKAHVCEIVELERVEATCETEGYIKYGCQCGEGVYTEPIYPQGHTYDVIAHEDATCGADGYNTLSCVDCGDSYNVVIDATGEHTYTYDCDKNCAACGNETRPEAEHEYFNDCETICMICYEETREANHNVLHVEAVEATCAAGGNIEYWYCDVCGAAWLDEACIMNTNIRAVKTSATGEHVYDNEFDVDCNECGGIREVETVIVTDTSNSVSEDVSGVATRFDLAVAGLAIKEGKYTQAEYANATIGGYKLISMGAIASNGASEVTIPCVYLCDLEADSAAFAARVINIPADKYDVEITFQSYFVIEIDGVEVTIYGETVSASYNGVLG